MTQRFDENPNHATRAYQVWLILISKAHNRQTLTYGMLGDLLGFQGAGVFDKILGHIMCYCRQNGLPPLTVIVVNQSTGLPGDGLILDGNPNEVRENVYNYQWFDIFPPTLEELSAAYNNG